MIRDITPIYTITSLYITEHATRFDQIDFKQYRDRIVGFYFDKETAIKCVEEDWAGFSEAGYYNYIVIEELCQGIYPCVSSKDDRHVWFYHDDDLNKWIVCDKPKCLKNTIGFSIG
jgi:hypothetical protein